MQCRARPSRGPTVQPQRVMEKQRLLLLEEESTDAAAATGSQPSGGVTGRPARREEQPVHLRAGGIAGQVAIPHRGPQRILPVGRLGPGSSGSPPPCGPAHRRRGLAGRAWPRGGRGVASGSTRLRGRARGGRPHTAQAPAGPRLRAGRGGSRRCAPARRRVRRRAGRQLTVAAARRAQPVASRLPAAPALPGPRAAPWPPPSARSAAR